MAPPVRPGMLPLLLLLLLPPLGSVPGGRASHASVRDRARGGGRAGMPRVVGLARVLSGCALGALRGRGRVSLDPLTTSPVHAIVRAAASWGLRAASPAAAARGFIYIVS